MPATKPAVGIRITVAELDRRLEEAYRADAVEAERINRDWDGVHADTATVSGRDRTKGPARTRSSRGARSRRR